MGRRRLSDRSGLARCDGFVMLHCNVTPREAVASMDVSAHVLPITGQTDTDAERFGMRAARLSAMAQAAVDIVPTVAISCEALTLIASDDAALAAVVEAVDSCFEDGTLLALRGSAQDLRWGGPERIGRIGASPDRPPITEGELSGDAVLIQHIRAFGVVAHDVDADSFGAPTGDGPTLADALQAFEAETGTSFPTCRRVQLAALLRAFARAWLRPTARILRVSQGAPQDAGLGAIVQVYCAAETTSFLQAVDTRTGERIDTFDETASGFEASALAVAAGVIRDAPSLEIGQWKGQASVLDLIPATRGRQAEIQIAVDLVGAGVLTRDEALLRIEPRSLSEHIHPQIVPDHPRDVLGYGIAASPGAARGPVVFSAEEAQAADAQGKRAILVRVETSPEDIRGMNSAAAVLTLTGGLTSHAAVIAQGLGVPCVVGASRLRIDPVNRILIAQDGRHIHAGDVITLDGSSGSVMMGALPLDHSALSAAFKTLMTWSDETRTIQVRANADTLQEARTAKRFLADGVGLCRTEHMFYDPDRLTVMRELIVADDEPTRIDALRRLLPMQRADFEALFEIMADAPVTIRLLDPPLHEFLPKEPEGVETLADATGLELEVVEARIAALEEVNPMLGKRGVRLAVTFPEIYEMQARAIFEAADAVANKVGRAIKPEIMIPLVSAFREVELVQERIHAVAGQVEAELGRRPEYKVGVMVETPRAALRAGDLATLSHFLSFGTNDLTQMTYGLSRDDAGRFMRDYVNAGVYPEDPFLTLDLEGVGELIIIASKRGRATNPDLELGLCGEHGGDPASVRFCRLAGFDYVSCSPYRVPIARLAAAQAELLSFTENDEAKGA